MENKISEGWLIFIIGAVQFINILDFMMVMPLGPDFAIALGIPTRDIGWIGGIYTFAAALSGFAGALFLDNYDRKKVLCVALTGLCLATFLCSFAWNFESLLAFRFIAGCFGGPLASVAIAIIADVVPPARRGAAMGKVMGAFSVASVLGVPFGLELSSRFGWQSPFIALSVIALLILIPTFIKLPKMNRFTSYINPLARLKILVSIVKSRVALATFTYMGLAMLSGFMIIPNISAHLQFNLSYPRDGLGMLYFFGGLVSFFGLRIAGKLTDKVGAGKVTISATAILIFAIFTGFVHYHNPMPVVVVFILFMLGMTSRNVCGQTVSSKVPPPQERAAFASVQSSIVHIFSAGGSFLASLMLTESAEHHLNGIENVGMLAIIIALLVPPLVIYVDRHVKRCSAPVMPNIEV